MLATTLLNDLKNSHTNRSANIYTMFHKKTTPYLIAHNFGKCWQIFKIFHPWTQQRSCNELIIKGPSHLKGVDTLPCEM